MDADSTFFPEFDDVTVNEVIIEVDLRDKGVEMVARLKKRSNFSEYVPPRDDKSENLAKHYSTKFSCVVAPFTVRLAHRLVSMWHGPMRKDGKPPAVRDFIKMSITHRDAFAELVNEAGQEMLDDDIGETEAVAKENFSEEEPAGDK